MRPERLYLLDVGALAAWKHYSVTDASTHMDMLQGVQIWLADFMASHEPTDVVACFDCSRETNWRKKRYVEYKSARDAKPADEAYIEALRKLPATFFAAGVPIVRHDGFEADDLIATFTAEKWAHEVMIVTRDKDMLQLVDERVKVFDPQDGKLYGPQEVLAKFYVPPHRMREFLAIAGDASDSIPHIKGLGKTFAANAIKQTRSRLELERRACAGELANITEKNQTLFAAGIETYKLAYELVGLRFDAPIGDDFSTRVFGEVQE